MWYKVVVYTFAVVAQGMCTPTQFNAVPEPDAMQCNARAGCNAFQWVVALDVLPIVAIRALGVLPIVTIRALGVLPIAAIRCARNYTHVSTSRVRGCDGSDGARVCAAYAFAPRGR